MNEHEDVLAKKAKHNVLLGEYDLAEEIFQNYSGDLINEVYNFYIDKMFYNKEFFRHYQNFYIYYHTVDLQDDPCPPYREYCKHLKKFDENDKDKKLLICGVMPLGDQIFFTRFLPVIENITKNITVITLPRLVDHFTKAFPDVKFVKDSSQIKVQDFECVLYMPFIPMFAFSKNNLLVKPLESTVKTNFKIVSRLRLLPQVKGKTIIGFSWKSARNDHRDDNDIGTAKNLLLRQLLPFFNIHNTLFVNLQHGNFQEELFNFAKKYNITNIVTFDELDMTSFTQHIFNYVDMCDFIIGPTNTLTIMAGALHKKTFAMVPNKNSIGRLWMYHDIRDDRSHAFFPTIRMYEQDELFRWEPAIELACKNLISEINET